MFEIIQIMASYFRKTYESNHVVQTSDIPVKLIVKCQGTVQAFQEKYERVRYVLLVCLHMVNRNVHAIILL